MNSAQNEAATITAEKRISTALKFNMTPAANYNLKSVQNIFAYSEKRKLWIKDLTIVKTSSKQAWINNGKRYFN